MSHIHIIIIIPPKYSVSDIIGQLKVQTASSLRKKFTWLCEIYWKENIVWLPGYFVSTIGVDEKSITKYVQFRESRDLGQVKFVGF